MISETKLRILCLDIETKPALAYVWSLFKVNIAINQIARSGETLCYAAKWVGEDNVMFDSVHNNNIIDMLQGMWKLMDEADVILTFNGARFDLPTLNKEFVKYGINPPSPYQQIDLYQTVKKQFKFQSNKLDFICQELGIGAKTQHKGMLLWTGCMEGNENDWKTMEEYNKQDVILLEKLYNKLIAWVPNHPNYSLYTPSDIAVCRHCGDSNLQRRGYAYTATQRYQRYVCNNCGSWMRERTTDVSKEEHIMARVN